MNFIASACQDNDLKRRQALWEEGCCVIPQVLDAGMVRRLRELTDRLLDQQDQEHFDSWRSPGSMVQLTKDPGFAELVAHPGLLGALASLGWESPSWANGYVISKPPFSPKLFWHQDWWGWDHPRSYEASPPLLFAFYYLVDTGEQNGCLRVIPGSHRKRHPLHERVCNAESDMLRRFSEPDHPAFSTVEEEVNVPVRAGDVLIGDARLLHASHANQSPERRTVIVTMYFPDFEGLPEAVRARYGAPNLAAFWPEETQALVKGLTPAYRGTARPVRWNYVPGPDLR